MSFEPVRLGIDFGTAHTVAVLEQPGRQARPLLFEGSPLLPSGVCLDPSGRLLAGQDALHTALTFPESFEPHPKRCIDDGSVLLGGQNVPVEEMIAAPLRRVATEAAIVGGAPIDHVVLTCPAAWGPQRRAVLRAAAARALPTTRLVTEPVAAASYFIHVAGHRLAPGEYALVYDFGAGTFDASVIQRTRDGLVVVAALGLPDAGGLDIDAAIVARIAATVGVCEPVTWQRLVRPATAADRRASRELWTGVRAAKEMLSRVTSTLVHVPLIEAQVPLGREELDELAGPVVARTVVATRSVLDDAGLDSAGLAAVFLSGGSSRLPAVAGALLRATGVPPVMVNEPELTVAEGSCTPSRPAPHPPHR
jgi:molecular chaperone DnaK (HSP70)